MNKMLESPPALAGDIELWGFVTENT